MRCLNPERAEEIKHNLVTPAPHGVGCWEGGRPAQGTSNPNQERLGRVYRVWDTWAPHVQRAARPQLQHQLGESKRVAVLTSDKVDFKTKRDKEGHYVIVKGLVQQEDITLVNIYAPSLEAPKCLREILEDLKKEIDRNTVMVGVSYTPLD